MRIVLYQPEIPQNVGTIIRLGACMEIPVCIIEPTSFIWSDKHLKRSAMDYNELCAIQKYLNFDEYLKQSNHRKILLTPHTDANFHKFQFTPNDDLIFGRESDGVPESVMHTADYCLKIPMVTGARSLNVALSVSMVLGEALRQTNMFPH